MFKKNNEPDPLDQVIDNIHTRMLRMDPLCEEYPKITERLTELYKIRANNKPDRVSKDAVAMIVGNLLGIGLILQHERAHVVATKALGFVRKLA